MTTSNSIPQLNAAAGELSGARKAAILLMGLGEPLSGNVLRELDHSDVRLISREIAALGTIPPHQTMQVFREFDSFSSNSRLLVMGGPERARRLLEQALGETAASDILSSSPAPGRGTHASGPGATFGGIDPDELSAVLRQENPQTLAVVLSNLPAAEAGPLLASLPVAIQSQVALRIALMDRVPADVFNQIAAAVKAKLKASKQILRSNGTQALAGILNSIGAENAEQILAEMEPQNGSATASVRQLMFVFDDITTIDKESIKVLLARVDRKALTTALKGTNEKIRTHFTQCMSQRSAEMLAEDMDALGPVRIRDVSAAQQQIIETMRQLQKEGAIASGSSGTDEYVV